MFYVFYTAETYNFTAENCDIAENCDRIVILIL